MKSSTAARVLLGVLVLGVVYLRSGLTCGRPVGFNELALLVLGVGYITYSIKPHAATSALLAISCIASAALLYSNRLYQYTAVLAVLALIILLAEFWGSRAETWKRTKKILPKLK